MLFTLKILYSTDKEININFNKINYSKVIKCAIRKIILVNSLKKRIK